MTKKHAIGLSKQSKIKVDPAKPNNKLNTLIVYADVPAGTPATALKFTYISSSSHIWDNPTTATLGTNTVTLSAYCLRRRARRHTLRTVSDDGSGDLTVTLVFDDNGSDVVDECTFDDVEYDD